MTKTEREAARFEAMKAFDASYHEQGLVCGVDEVGRGPLAGPVTVCACILPADFAVHGINDSKKLSEKRREALAALIASEALDYRLVSLDERRIDEINILEATKEAMRRAVRGLTLRPHIVLTDAVQIPDLQIPQDNIISGDAKSLVIAAASILAKVARDRYMAKIHEEWPAYDWVNNKGYGTEKHRDALSRFGLTPYHRRSFCKRYL
ncbi:MAG: ribonuclease HII [Eubacteriales bacterium]|nr:ribonuclease HII [Eubacteriales bacterium]